MPHIPTRCRSRSNKAMNYSYAADAGWVVAPLERGGSPSFFSNQQDTHQLEAAHIVSTPVILGVFAIIVALSILCFTAYKMKAKRFEFSSAVWKFFSLKIIIVSDAGSEPAEQTTPEP